MNDYLDERRAYREMARVITEVEAEPQPEPGEREPLFDDAATSWLVHLENEKRAKPSTLAGYRILLAEPRHGDRTQKGARIMRAFGGQKLRGIKTDDIRRFLSSIDKEPVSARTVNMHRQVLHAIFQHALRSDTFGLRENPVAATGKRPEEGAQPVETFEPQEIVAIASAARSGLHRKRSGYANSKFSEETKTEWQRINDQDAALFIVGMHRPAHGRAPRTALVRCRPRGRHLDGLEGDVGGAGVEHQVAAGPIGAARRAG